MNATKQRIMTVVLFLWGITIINSYHPIRSVGQNPSKKEKKMIKNPVYLTSAYLAFGR